jgi:hypothetical protein
MADAAGSAAVAAALGRPAQGHVIYETWEQVRSYESAADRDGALGWRRTSFQRELLPELSQSKVAQG